MKHEKGDFKMSGKGTYKFTAMPKGIALEILDEYKEIQGDEETIQSKEDIYLLIECAYARGWLDSRGVTSK